MSQGLPPPPGFPPEPQDFKENAQKMMMECSKKGFAPPIFKDSLLNNILPKQVSGNPIPVFSGLLSSLPALFSSVPRTTVRPELDPASVLTEKVWNSTNLTQMIEPMMNNTDKSNCFIRALVAPQSWMTIVTNATQLDVGNLKKLLWGARPFLETSSTPLVLPQTVQMPQLAEIMKMFNDIFSSLTERQQDQVRQWMKDKVIDNDPSCKLNQSRSVLSSILTPMLPVKPGLFNPLSDGCPPKMPWLKADSLKIMGRFVSQLPVDEVKAIPTDELCKFFQTPEFLQSFSNVGKMNTGTGRIFLQRLKLECLKQNFLNQLDRLGSLLCFLDDTQGLNDTLSKKLLSQLGDCDNSGNDMIKRELVKKLTVDFLAPPTPELLQSLGFGVSILPPSKLSNCSFDALNKSMFNLRQADWNPAQAKILAQKLLQTTKNITGENLLFLGSMVRGVDSEALKKVKAQGLLGNDGLKNISEKMSCLQKKSLLLGMCADANATNIVREVPNALVPFLSLSTLDKANLTSVDQLGGRSWSRTQSLYLVKKLVGNGIKPEQVRKLGQAVQGLTCQMIEDVSQSDSLEVTQTLANSQNMLSRTQIRCMALKLFQSLEAQRPLYFTTVSDSELQAIPASLLIHLPAQAIQGLPAAVCPRFLEKMNQANLSSLPNRAPSRLELKNKALSCLGKSPADLSAAEVLYLGPLVCEVDPTWISSLNALALNSTLQALATCKHIPRPNREPLFQLLTKTYGDPSTWSEEVMKSLGPLILLNETALEMMPSKTWLKASLSELLDGMAPQADPLAPEEFRSWADPMALQRKLFQLTTTSPQLRRKRAATLSSMLAPTLAVIEELGRANTFWSPVQLTNMTVQTFRDGMSILGGIRNFSAEQLVALRNKAIEAWGDVTKLNESKILEMGCVSVSFDPKQLQSFNITSMDTMEVLSPCQWNQMQAEAIWWGFTNRTGIRASKLGAVDMSGLGNFICGLQPNETEQLSTTEFKDAVVDVGKAQCPPNIMECLKKKAIAAFGDPKGWVEADISAMGNIIAALNASELASLKPSVLPLISPSAISLIPPDRLSVLSLSQLRALGPDNAAALTQSQRAALGVEQRAAVDESIGVRSSTPVPNGVAPKQSMVGIVVLLQPLILLLLGYIL
ncbi:otoancorin [Trichomycterus rosablanca]|uniref:otoancorin n=1 Tax=Trichomycterus rosablanca TaxID=2290929 RepID=UPI002F354A71